MTKMAELEDLVKIEITLKEVKKPTKEVLLW